jgi:hypothetical protein
LLAAFVKLGLLRLPAVDEMECVEQEILKDKREIEKC